MGSEGSTVRLECKVYSIPKPERITWFHHGREVESNDDEYRIFQEPLADGMKSVLVIRTSQETDFGVWNCSVSNQYGTHLMEIYLMKQKHPELVVILTCVIGGVVIIVAMTMITLLCQRKTRKMDMMEADGMEKETKQSDRSSNNDSDLKVEIRTASSLSNMPVEDSEHWDDEGSDALKNESLYRYSDYIDPVFPPKPDGNGTNNNGNGYIGYVDYSREFNMGPPLRNSVYSGLVGMGGHHSPQYLNNTDPRYSATYGNPYLRTSNNSLPPPHVANNHSPSGVQQRPILNHTNHTTAQPPPPKHHMPPSYGPLRNGGSAVPQVARSPSTPSPHSTGTVPPQYIVPSATQLKPGTLATHV